MEKVCDLHVHSVFSDGTDTPKEIVKKAKKLNIKAVALTDHNTTSGLYEFEKAGKELEEHVKSGGSLEDIANVMGEMIEESGFFRALNKDEEQEVAETEKQKK